MISTTCEVCGKEIRIEFEMKGEGQTFMLPGNLPQRAIHCKGGKGVVVPGKITAFYEMVDGKPVAVKPIVSDPLDD